MKSLSFVPYNDRIVIESESAERVTKGNIIIPESVKQKMVKGEVIAVGPGRLLESGQRSVMPCKVGDTVLHAEYAGQQVEIDGKPYIIMRDVDLFGVFPPVPKK